VSATEHGGEVADAAQEPSGDARLPRALRAISFGASSDTGTPSTRPPRLTISSSSSTV